MSSWDADDVAAPSGLNPPVQSEQVQQEAAESGPYAPTSTVPRPPGTGTEGANGLLCEARAAHARGWSLTPLNGKRPKLKGWQKLGPPSLAEVERWSAEGNLGVRTGSVSGLVVIDDDTPDQSAAERLGLPPTVTAITGGGGRHYYFAVPEVELRSSVRKLGPGIDVRGEGGQVVLPGSVHPESGALYRWLAGHGPRDLDLAPFPTRLLPQPEGLRERRVESAPSSRAVGSLIERSCAEVRSAPPGQRNDTLNRVAYFLGGIVGRGDLRAEDVETALLEAGMSAGLSEREVRATVASGLSKGFRAPLPRPSDAAARASRRSAAAPSHERTGSAPLSAPNQMQASTSASQPLLSSDTKPKKRPVPPQRAFPLHLLPAATHSYCEAVAAARSVDVSMVASAMLVSLGSAIGLTRCAWDEFAKWSEPAAIWMAIVMRSGGRKSPVLDDVFAVHHERQAALHDDYIAAQEVYLQELEEYEHALKSKSRRAEAGKVPRKPKPPKLEHVYTTDVTPEAMVRMLADTSRGMLVLGDELAGFFGGMGRYGNGRTDAERAFWLSVFRATSAKIDRASKDTIFVKRGLASIAGGVQPSILLRCFDEATFGSGLASRFLLVMPKMAVKEYRKGPSAEDERSYRDLLTALLGLEFGVGVDARGNSTKETIRVPFSDDCREFLREWIPVWSAEALESSEPIEAAMSKLEGYALRFALIFKTCREALGLAAADDPIEASDLQAGAELARWYRDEAIRVYLTLGQELETENERVLEARVAVVRSRGGAVTVREWRQRNTRKTQAQAREELDQLVKAELATWCMRPSSKRGGAATEECRLIGTTEPGDRGPGIDADDREGGDDTSGTGPEDLEVGTHLRRGPSGETEVPLCVEVAKRASAGRSGDHGAAMSEVPVAGCVVQVPSALPTKNALLGPKKGGGSPATTGFEGTVHNTTPVSKEGPRYGTESRGAEASCTTHNATRNLGYRSASEVPLPLPHGEAAPHPGPVEDLVSLSAAILDVMPGSREVGPSATVIPIEPILGLTPAALGPCVRCGSTAYWRLRDSGRSEPGEPRCLRCYPAHPGDDRVEFLETDGGAA